MGVPHGLVPFLHLYNSECTRAQKHQAVVMNEPPKGSLAMGQTAEVLFSSPIFLPSAAHPLLPESTLGITLSFVKRQAFAVSAFAQQRSPIKTHERTRLFPVKTRSTTTNFLEESHVRTPCLFSHQQDIRKVLLKAHACTLSQSLHLHSTLIHHRGTCMRTFAVSARMRTATVPEQSPRAMRSQPMEVASCSSSCCRRCMTRSSRAVMSRTLCMAHERCSQGEPRHAHLQHLSSASGLHI